MAFFRPTTSITFEPRRSPLGMMICAVEARSSTVFNCGPFMLMTTKEFSYGMAVNISAIFKVTGAAGVAAGAIVAAALGLLLAGRSGVDLVAWSLILGCAAVVIEAASPHGWDNLTLLVGIAWLTRWCEGG